MIHSKTANVTNAGQATAQDVYADISISGNASIVSGADPQPLADIGANETKTVTAAGTDANLK